MSQELNVSYRQHKEKIVQRLSKFEELPARNYFNELQFCLLTPQSNAHRCWEAVQEINKLNKQTPSVIREILRTRTRFHNNKTRYLLEARKNWPSIKQFLTNTDRKSIRNNLAEEILGMGYKEAGHFLRNIGKSNNQIAILDRHILRNLEQLKVITKKDLIIKNAKHYKQIEDKFLAFSKQVNIPIDHLDLLFWSKETGEVFK
ncbi:MAG: DNA lyase [Nanoarchaeota archaeon]